MQLLCVAGACTIAPTGPAGGVMLCDVVECCGAMAKRMHMFVRKHTMRNADEA